MLARFFKMLWPAKPKTIRRFASPLDVERLEDRLTPADDPLKASISAYSSPPPSYDPAPAVLPVYYYGNEYGDDGFAGVSQNDPGSIPLDYVVLSPGTSTSSTSSTQIYQSSPTSNLALPGPFTYDFGNQRVISAISRADLTNQLNAEPWKTLASKNNLRDVVLKKFDHYENSIVSAAQKTLDRLTQEANGLQKELQASLAEEKTMAKQLEDSLKKLGSAEAVARTSLTKVGADLQNVAVSLERGASSLDQAISAHQAEAQKYATNGKTPSKIMNARARIQEQQARVQQLDLRTSASEDRVDALQMKLDVVRGKASGSTTKSGSSSTGKTGAMETKEILPANAPELNTGDQEKPLVIKAHLTETKVIEANPPELNTGDREEPLVIKASITETKVIEPANRPEKSVEPVEKNAPNLPEVVTEKSKGKQDLSKLSVAELADLVLHHKNITLATTHISGVKDQATPYQEIKDAARGLPVKRSAYQNAPGGEVMLDRRVLVLMLELAEVWSFRVTEIAGGSHDGTIHYTGRAFDIGSINGQMVSPQHPSYRQFESFAETRGAKTLGPGDPKHDDHLHISFLK